MSPAAAPPPGSGPLSPVSTIALPDHPWRCVSAALFQISPAQCAARLRSRVNCARVRQQLTQSHSRLRCGAGRGGLAAAARAQLSTALSDEGFC